MFNETIAETDSLITDSVENGTTPLETLQISQSDSAAVFRRFIQITEDEKLMALNRTENKKKNDITTDENDQMTLNKDKLQIKTLFQSVLSNGMETLERISSQNTSSSSGESRSTKNQVFNLDLHEVSLSNFGPYGGSKVNYPLQKRCVRTCMSACVRVFVCVHKVLVYVCI